jgi:hypothetical protein
MVAESAELVDEVAVDEQQDAAARRLAELLSLAAIDSLIADAEAWGMQTFSWCVRVMPGEHVLVGWFAWCLGQVGAGWGGIQDRPRSAWHRVSIMLWPCFAAVDRYPRMV